MENAGATPAARHLQIHTAAFCWGITFWPQRPSRSGVPAWPWPAASIATQTLRFAKTTNFGSGWRGRERHLIEALRSTAAAASACAHIVLGRHWEMIGQLVRAVRRRVIGRLSI